MPRKSLLKNSRAERPWVPGVLRMQ